MSIALLLEHSFVDALPDLGADWSGAEAPSPELVALNTELAQQLGLEPSWLESAEGIAVLSGRTAPEDSHPIAMAYAGHQFGGYSPLLGDGRALLLGEITTPDGALVDLHLKGSGRTPFARGGDGKATIAAMLREFLMAEAMYALGVPTTRALAVVTTGEEIVRTGYEPGAVLTRVGASHIRVGTFQLARAKDPALVRQLADYAIDRHYPALADSENRYLSFLEQVVEAQAQLVAKWMELGFIHGVMNTDNVLISGETIDYGPCAFMDRYDPLAVFSSIDHGGRYAFQNQPPITVWNLARLAETMLVLFDEDEDAAVSLATDVVQTFPDRFNTHWVAGMRNKLGLAHDVTYEDASALIEELLSIMTDSNADYTSTFRALAASLRGKETLLETELTAERSAAWVERWRALLGTADLVIVADAMDEVNPIYVPRNHLVEEVLNAATTGDLDPFRELLEAVTTPFSVVQGRERFAVPAPASFADGYQTFCGT